MAIDYGQPKDGITSATPQNILFGAGTIHKGLQWIEASGEGETGHWNFAESLFCATGDGNTLKIEPEVTNIEVDGAWVKVQDLQVKTGETATMEITPVELTPAVLKSGLIAQESATSPTGFTALESKELIESGDYIENLGYVGTRIDGTPIIIIFERALCTSGMEIGGSDKEASKPSLTFECVGKLADSHRTLPWHIYYPTAAETQAEG